VDDLSVGESIRDIYDYSENADPEWRRLSAMGKAGNIVKLCSGYPHRRILEIGAGDGAILARLSDLGFGDEFFALEVSQSAVAAMNERKIAPLRECRLFDGYHIPYQDSSFHLAILSHVLEHVEYPRKLLYEARRVAGYVFIEVPLEETIRLPKDFTFDRVGHINSYTFKGIRRLVQSTGLVVIGQLVTHPPYSTYAYRLGKKAFLRYCPKQCLLRISPALATRLLTYNCSLICRP
jgi:ubiquinone/menaquinone biosynthesis C-methylase UbiE